MRRPPILLIIAIACFGFTTFGQTYQNSDTVPGRGFGNTGMPLIFNQFFDQSKILSTISSPENPIVLTLNANEDGSKILETKIIEVSDSGGGYILIEASGSGPIQLTNVELGSNIHLMFKSDIQLEFPSEKGGNMFIVGKKKELKNIAITCYAALGNTTNESDWFRVSIGNLLENGGINSEGNTVNRNFCKLNHVSNFKISGVIIQDKRTNINAINMASRDVLVNSGGTYNGKADGRIVDCRDFGPSNGIVSNIRLTNGAGGYGLLQAQIARHVLFYNLTSINGGVALRFESGSPAANNTGFVLQDGEVIPNPNPTNKETLVEVYGRKIRSEKGSIALLLNPHRVKQGVVDIDDVSSKGSVTAIKVENGFKDSNGQPETVEKKGPVLDQYGDFDPASIISNVKAESGGDHDAKYSRRAARYLTCHVFNTEVKPYLTPGETSNWQGKSIGGIEDNARPEGEGFDDCTHGCYTIHLPEPYEVLLTGDNFARENLHIFSESANLSTVNKAGDCKEDTPSTSIHHTNMDKNATVYPSLTNALVNLPQNSSWNLYRIDGALMAQGMGSQLDLSLKNNGIYILKINDETHKIIKY